MALLVPVHNIIVRQYIGYNMGDYRLRDYSQVFIGFA